ncbi:hypothetical protein H5410_034337 [Solanum commersonii]|uniref:Yippee domain-containing protein n=1 Tax=Solanum commersonii TaxID=4109 RepID=A0A9J5YT49_SOLCO|nr:hypothetical protein H5410_034337 [Solanum commersonii]
MFRNRVTLRSYILGSAYRRGLNQVGGANAQVGGPNAQVGGANAHVGGANAQDGGPNNDKDGGPNDQDGDANDQDGGPNDQDGCANDQDGGPNEQVPNEHDYQDVGTNEQNADQDGGANEQNADQDGGANDRDNIDENADADILLIQNAIILGEVDDLVNGGYNVKEAQNEQYIKDGMTLAKAYCANCKKLLGWKLIAASQQSRSCRVGGFYLTLKEVSFFDNVMLHDQKRRDNEQNVDQGGGANEQNVYQGGGANAQNVDQGEGANEQNVDQGGGANEQNVDQGGGANEQNVDQGGDANEPNVDQDGGTNEQNVVQDGGANEQNVVQDGGANEKNELTCVLQGIFTDMFNVEVPENESYHQLLEGNTVVDTFCVNCRDRLGWKFIAVPQGSRYEEGQFLMMLEKLTYPNGQNLDPYEENVDQDGGPSEENVDQDGGPNEENVDQAGGPNEENVDQAGGANEENNNNQAGGANEENNNNQDGGANEENADNQDGGANNEENVDNQDGGGDQPLKASYILQQLYSDGTDSNIISSFREIFFMEFLLISIFFNLRYVYTFFCCLSLIYTCRININIANVSNYLGTTVAKTYCSKCEKMIGWRIIAVTQPSEYIKEGRFCMRLDKLSFSNNEQLIRPIQEQNVRDNEENADQERDTTEGYGDSTEEEMSANIEQNVDQDGGLDDDISNYLMHLLRHDQGGGGNEQNHDQDGGLNEQTLDQVVGANQQNVDQHGGDKEQNHDKDRGANEQTVDKDGGANEQNNLPEYNHIPSVHYLYYRHCRTQVATIQADTPTLPILSRLRVGVPEDEDTIISWDNVTLLDLLLGGKNEQAPNDQDGDDIENSRFFTKVFNVEVAEDEQYNPVLNGMNLATTYCGKCRTPLGWRVIAVSEPSRSHKVGGFYMRLKWLHEMNHDKYRDRTEGYGDSTEQEVGANEPNFYQDGDTTEGYGDSTEPEVGANEPNFDQDGGVNEQNFDQDGGVNEQNADQHGGGNEQNVGQDGGGNEQNTDQLGGGNEQNADQHGGGNEQTVGQDGGANEQNADQHGGGNEQTVRQDGGSNEQTADEHGGSNEQNVGQDGGANEQNADQHGGRNEQTVGQDGGANEQNADQHGGGNEQTVGQDGGANEQNADQHGGGNEQTVGQDGGANEQNADQHGGGNEQAVGQDGGGNEQTADEHGGSNE